MPKENIDKIGIIVPNGNYTYIRRNKEYNPHIYSRFGKYGCNLTVSSRAMLKMNELPKISKNNIGLYTPIIERATNINIDENTLLNSHLYWLDVCTDVINDTGLDNKDFIGILREQAYQKTSKHEVIVGFDKEKGFECSLTIKSSCKTIKDSLAIYSKIPEIKSNMYSQPDYYNNFSPQYMLENAYLIRNERRMQSLSAIKKAYHLEQLSVVTLNDIFACEANVVADKIMDIFLK